MVGANCAWQGSRNFAANHEKVVRRRFQWNKVAAPQTFTSSRGCGGMTNDETLMAKE
jgi:hypothetical protein